MQSRRSAAARDENHQQRVECRQRGGQSAAARQSRMVARTSVLAPASRIQLNQQPGRRILTLHVASRH